MKVSNCSKNQVCSHVGQSCEIKKKKNGIIHIPHIFPSLLSPMLSFCSLNNIELASTMKKISLQFLV